MNYESHDILSRKKIQTTQILKMITIYCRKHRMLDLDLKALSTEEINIIGNEIVDLFLDRIADSEKKA